MPPYKKKPMKYNWFERLVSYEILSMPIKTWGLLIIFFGCIFGFIIFMLFQVANYPPTSKTFIAEVSKIWLEQHESDTGGSRIYRVRLKREEDEVTCTIPSINISIWQSLETDISYEFSISQTLTGCYVNKAVKIEEQDSFEFDN
jgi:hypothetical protein